MGTGTKADSKDDWIYRVAHAGGTPDLWVSDAYDPVVAGVAVSGMMMGTTVLATLAMLTVWEASVFVAIPFLLIFGAPLVHCAVSLWITCAAWVTNPGFGPGSWPAAAWK